MEQIIPLSNNYLLTRHNTFGVAAKAACYANISAVSQLEYLIRSPIWQGAAHYVLGDGSNTLFMGDFNGVVVHMTIPGIQKVSEDAQTVVIEAGAGVPWQAVVEYAVSRGWGGIENLSWIPGTVGAAPIQNIGAYGVELQSVFESLQAFDVARGKRQHFDAIDCAFGYRDSIFKQAARDQYVITSVRLRLSKTPTLNTQYQALAQYFEQRSDDTLSIRAVSDAVIAIRQSKLPDPAVIPNAGSFFKNPIVAGSAFQTLQSTLGDIPHFLESASRIKIPAAWLIEQCGWKGKRQGAVGVHDQQALVLVNHGGASGHDIAQLAQQIMRDVDQRFGIQLQPEVRMVGEHSV